MTITMEIIRMARRKDTCFQSSMGALGSSLRIGHSQSLIFVARPRRLSQQMTESLPAPNRIVLHSLNHQYSPGSSGKPASTHRPSLKTNMQALSKTDAAEAFAFACGMSSVQLSCHHVNLRLQSFSLQVTEFSQVYAVTN